MLKKVGGRYVVFTEDGFRFIEDILPELIKNACKDNKSMEILKSYTKEFGLHVSCGENQNTDLLEALLTMYEAVSDVMTYLNNKEGELLIRIKDIKAKYMRGQIQAADVIKELENVAKTIGTSKWYIRDVMTKRLGMSPEVFIASITKGGNSAP